MSQLDIFENITPQNIDNRKKDGLTIIQNGEYLFFPNYFLKSESDLHFNSLCNEISWKQESMNMYGKKVNFPRLTAWYGNNDKQYSFSGITLQPLPWTSNILAIKNKIELCQETEFNSVLLNRYRDGSDSISWHTDAERELGVNPIIASANFGASRNFQLRHIITKQKIEIELTHGSLLIMRGQLQHYWQHQIAKTSKPVGERINLTFRTIK